MRNSQVATTSISLSAKSKIHSEAHEDSSQVSSSSSIRKSSSLFLPPRLSQASHIHCRLVYRLGVDPKQTIQKCIKPVANSVYEIIRTKQGSPPYLQPLRDDVNGPSTTRMLKPAFTSSAADPNNYHHDIYDGRTANSTVAQSHPKSIKRICDASAISSNRRTVRFDNSVLVIPIPSRNAYSNRIKKALWRNKNELRDIVHRNRCEYLAEGWEWSKVIEDEDMYIEASTGEKIHPCWVEGEEFDVLKRIESLYRDC